jgi:hypothetical protein
MRAISFGWILILACFPTPMCRADDGSIRAVGGAVTPLHEHPAIHLEAEYVHAWVGESTARVEAVFFLHNDGPATTVMMGFPNESGGADVEHIVGFSEFSSFVDGDSVGTTIRPDSLHQVYGDYRCWYTKSVSFDSNQRRCIRDTYSAELGHSVPTYRWFQYILWSGATWAGPIGVADIVVTVEAPGISLDSLSVEPKGYRRSGKELRWHFVNFEPGHGSDVHVAWH